MFAQLSKDAQSIPNTADIQRPSIDNFDSEFVKRNKTLTRGKASDKLTQKMQYLYKMFGKPTPDEPAQDYSDGSFWTYEEYKLVPLEQTEWFKQDYLGLKTLEDEHRVLKLHLGGGHDEFSPEDVKKTFAPALML